MKKAARFTSSKLKEKNQKIFLQQFVEFFFVFPVLLICFLGFGFWNLPNAFAANGINKQINFQGKLVDNNGLNVADSSYTVIFSLYRVSSGGTAAWIESDSLTTSNGVFQVALGAVTAFPGNVDFNSDTWYLGIKVGADAEMTPRVRFSAVPYAFNAAALDGVVATNSATQFTLTGGTDALIDLTVNGSLTLGSIIKPTAAGVLAVQSNGANGLTLDTGGAAAMNIGTTANSITFGATNNPTYAFNGSGVVTFQGTSFTLGNGGTTTIQTTSNAGLTLLSAGSGNITLGQNLGNGTVVVSPNAGGQAALVVNKIGANGDLFTASASGITKFSLDSGGNATLSGSISVGGAPPSGYAGLVGNFNGINSTGTIQVNVQNKSNGNGASSDFIATEDNGTDSSNYIDFGINGSGYNQAAYNIGSAGDGYLYTSNGALSIGTASNKPIVFHTNGTTSTDEVLRIDSSGFVSIGTQGVTNANAGLIINQTNNSGLGDIFTASVSGTQKFTVKNNGTVGLDTTNYNACGALATDVSGIISCVAGASSDNLSNVYAITVPSGTNLHMVFTGSAGSTPSSTSGTLTFPSDTTKLVIELKAGGGGGGAVGTGNTGKAGGGGGEGGFSKKLITSVATDYYIKVGGGGAGGASGSNNGALGTSSCFGTNSSDACTSSLASATGGSGGTFSITSTPVAGGAGGAGGNGDSSQTGSAGHDSISSGTGAFCSGAGGGVGGAVSPACNVAGAGNNGSSGGGGSGGQNTGTNNLNPGGAGGAGYVIISVYTNSGNGGGSDNWYQYTTGVLSPLSSTTDVLFGSNATSSAKFGFLNVATGTPTASISAGISGAIFLKADGSLQTTAFQTLSLGGSTTGNINIGTDATGRAISIGNSTVNTSVSLTTGGTGLITLGSNTGVGNILVQPNAGGQAALIINKPVATGDLFTASSSGTTKFTITNSGAASASGSLTLDTTGTISTTKAQTLTIGDTKTGFINVGTDATARVVTIGNSTTTSTLNLTAGSGSINFYTTSNNLTSSGALTLAGSVSSAGLTSTGTVAVNAAGGITSNQATLIINAGGNVDVQDTFNADNITTDTGGISIASAQSYTGAGAVTYTSANGQTLTLDSGTTGALNIGTGANGKTITIGNSTANTALTLTTGGTGLITLGSNTGVGNILVQPNAGGQAALIVNKQSATGDIFVASASGTTLFRIANTGGVLFQGDYISSSSSASFANNGSGSVENVLGDEGSMIPNAGFEANNSGSSFADGWVVAATNSAAVTRDTTIQAKGTSSVRVTLNNSSTAFYSACIPITGTVNNVYTANWYVKANSASFQPTVRAYLDGFATKTDCQNNKLVQAPTPIVTTVIQANTNWNTYGSGATAIPNTSFGSTTTFARVHFFVATASNTFINIDGVRLIELDNTKGLDYAENYPADPNDTPEAGDVVSLASIGNIALVKKADKPYDSAVLGVVSTQPGQLLDDGSVTDPKVPVALAGRIPTKVSTLNGPIHIGDYLTSSNIPGVAVKAMSSGTVIGIAMQDYTSDDPTQVEPIVMFVKNSYYAGSGLSGAGDGFVSLIGDPVDPKVFASTDAVQNTVASAAAQIASQNNVLSPIPATHVIDTLLITKVATISGKLRVKGDGLFEGVVNVVGTLMTNSLIVNSVSDFFGIARFHNDISIDGHIAVLGDTAGTAIVKKGDSKTAVKFTNAYDYPPIVTATLLLDQENATNSAVMQSTFFKQGYTYVVTDVTQKGFSLLLNKDAVSDVILTWTALGRGIVTPTPE